MRFCLLALSIPILWLNATAGHAQTVIWDDAQDADLPVHERLPEDLRAKPLRYNGLQYQAALNLETRYDNNVLATQRESSDYILALKPSLLVSRDYGAHKLRIGVQSEIERFTDQKEENKENLSLFARGALFAERQWSFPFLVNFRKEARKRNNLQTTITDEPEDIERFGVEAGVQRNFNRLSVSLLGEYQNIAFDDGTALGATTPVIFSDDDHKTYRAKLSARYDISQGTPGRTDTPSHILFADFIYGRQRFDSLSFVNTPAGGNFSGISGDRDEVGILAGLESSYKGLLFARLGAGYIRQNFDDETLDDISAIDLSADLSYNLTPKLTLGLKAERDINQDNGFTQGITQTSVVFNTDYEILHNLYLGGSVGYSDYEFEDLDRNDDDITAGLELSYYNSPRIQTSFGVNWQERTSNINAAEFDRLVFLLSVTGRL